MYTLVLLTEKHFESAAQQILKTLIRNATYAIFQNKKLTRNATSVIAEVALCPPLLFVVHIYPPITKQRKILTAG